MPKDIHSILAETEKKVSIIKALVRFGDAMATAKNDSLIPSQTTLQTGLGQPDLSQLTRAQVQAVLPTLTNVEADKLVEYAGKLKQYVDLIQVDIDGNKIPPNTPDPL